MATTYDLTQLAGNDPALSPVYTSDPTQAATALQTMQSELAYAQANPNDPNSAYVISQLTPAIQEQQNVVGYDQAQSTVNTDAGTANYLGGIFNNILQGNGGNYNLVGTGDMKAVLQYLQQNNINPVISSITGQTIQQAMQNAINGGNNAYTFGDISKFLNQLNIPSQAINSIQGQLNAANSTLATDQGKVINNLTYAQPNYAGMSQQISNTFGGPNNGNPTGLYGSTVVPQLQDIYAVAYNNKMGTTAQLQNMGLGSSGAMKEAQQNQNDKALNKSLSSLSNFNNQEASVQNALQQQQQQQQAQYQTTLNSLKGNTIGNLLSGSANNLGQSFSNNMNANTQTALNNAQNNLLQQQQSDNALGGLFNNLGNLAGTAVGTAINPVPGTI